MEIGTVEARPGELATGWLPVTDLPTGGSERLPLVVAEVLPPHGEPVEAVESEHDGYVLGRREGLAVCGNDAVASVAVRDDDLVVPGRTDSRDAAGASPPGAVPGGRVTVHRRRPVKRRA